MTTTVFVCGKKPWVKVQLEVPEHVLNQYKDLSKIRNLTPKELMEWAIAKFIHNPDEWKGGIE